MIRLLAVLLALMAMPAAAKDWTQVTSIAPSGGFVLGNPAAKVRLVEYSSFTCPHCAHFAETGMAALRSNYIRTGKVAFESRSAVRDGVDLVATLLARCRGPGRYFAASELVFARQEQWVGAAMTYQEANGEQLTKQAPADAMAAIAAGSGLDVLLGLTPVRAKACLADKAGQARVAAMADEAWNKRRISGTPSFMINGVAVDALDWATLDLRLRDATR